VLCCVLCVVLCVVCVEARREEISPLPLPTGSIPMSKFTSMIWEEKKGTYKVHIKANAKSK
jgi:hypothetical protein